MERKGEKIRKGKARVEMRDKIGTAGAIITMRRIKIKNGILLHLFERKSRKE